MTLFLHEFKINIKSLLIWSVSVGAFCLMCILVYDSMEGSMEQMSDMFSELGSFSAALGIDKISIGTLEGFYAIEVAIIFTLGGAMYAAILGSSLVAKEEEGHTSEFLNTFPISRQGIVIRKYLSMLALIVVFQLITLAMIALGFGIMKTDFLSREFILYHAVSLVMHIEIGSICFMLSSILKKKPTGAALGIVILLYMFDLMLRVVPALENMKYITPFYYSNGSSVFSGEAINTGSFLTGIFITVTTVVLSVIIYKKRNLSA